MKVFEYIRTNNKKENIKNINKKHFGGLIEYML